MLAKNGFSGATHILEGKQGFFAGYARQEVCYDLFKDFGEKWRAGLISFKPYPCCRHTHSAIDAALDIRRQAAGRGLKTIRLLTYTTANTVAGASDRPSSQIQPGVLRRLHALKRRAY